MSKDRLLSAINLEEPDRVPICFRGVSSLEHLWKDRFERVKKLAELGVDDKLQISAPWVYHPDVVIKQREIRPIPPEKYPIIVKEIETPKGTLRMAVKKSEVQAYEGAYSFDDIPIVSNQNWPRGVEFLLKDCEDLKKLSYLLYYPDKTELQEFYEHVRAVKEFAGDRVLVEGTIIGTTSLAFHLYGPKFMLAVFRDRDFVMDLLNMFHEWEMNRLKILLDVGVDTVYIDSGWCETTQFWSPRIFRNLFAPLLYDEVELTHHKGVPFHYFTVTGIMPLLQEYKEIGFDILSTLPPPPQGDTDLKRVKDVLGESMCLWGGIDAAYKICTGSPDDVKESVCEAIPALAPSGGYVLSTAGSLLREPYRNVMTLIKSALELGEYPIKE